ncbi:MAG: TonB family protein [Alteromonadaceae bacterium]|nr:TonB family protein [Alteromonadaceae bacterium]
MLENPFLYSLAITLIHFIWQGCLVALVLKLIFTFISPKNPQLRYAASAIAMLASLAMPLITFFIVYQVGFDKLTNSNEMIIGFVNNITQNKESDFSANIVEYLPFLSLAWLISISYLAIKLIFDIYYVKQLTQVDATPAEQSLQKRFIALANKMHLWRMPRLLISLKAEIPMAVGWLKPVVLLPVSMISGLTSAQLEMLLLHELAHIKRHDYLINFMQTLIEILLFFHPAIRWVSTQMRNEREFCSDDIAVAQCCKPIAYARTLAETAALCQKRAHQHSIPQMALAASGGDLKQRVIRLVDSHCTSSNDFGKWLAGIFVLLSVITLSTRPVFNLPILEDKLAYLPFYATVQPSVYEENIALNPIDLTQTPITQHLLYNDQANKKTIDNMAINTKTPEQNIKLTAKIKKPVFSIATKNESTLKTLSMLTTGSRQKKSIKSSSTTTMSKRHIVKTIINQQPQPLLTTQKTVALLTKQVLSGKQSSPTKQQQNLLTTKKFNTTNIKTKTKHIIDNNSFIKKPTVNSQLNLTNTEKLKYSLINNTDNIDVLAQFNTPINPYAAQLAELAQPITNKHIATPPLKKAAQLISSFAPKYPQIAKRKKIELEILVHFVVGVDGYVRDIKFVQQNKIAFFRRSIRTAMRKWRFEPAQIKGKKVKSKMSKIFSFNLAD